MKVAIFHDFFDKIGGGERLVLELARGLGADIITTNLDSGKAAKLGFKDVKIIGLPLLFKSTPLKQLSACFAFAMGDFRKDYDFFIFSGFWAIFAADRHKPNIYYCHSPLRELYDLKDFYRKRTGLHKKAMQAFADIFFKPVFERQIGKVQKIVTNSENIGKKIKKYYKRDAIVVFPPTDTEKYKCSDFGNYWLSVNRLYHNKRVEMQLEAFREMPKERLVVVGGYAKGDDAEGYAEKLLMDKPKNVEFASEISEEKLVDLYANCRGFIATAIDEDFGMSVVEAMAAGKAVVAVDEGGFKETVVDGKTGFLVDADVDDIVEAVQKVSENPGKYRKACVERAKEFGKERFVEKMKKEILEMMK